MKNKKSFCLNKRAIVSVALFVIFILLPISGRMIEFTRENLATMYIWVAIHCLSGLLFMAFGLFHIVYNWKTLTRYLRKK